MINDTWTLRRPWKLAEIALACKLGKLLDFFSDFAPQLREQHQFMSILAQDLMDSNVKLFLGAGFFAPAGLPSSLS